DTPNVQTDFEPSLAIYNPDGTVNVNFVGGWPGVRQIAFGTLTQSGTYTAQVKNYDSGSLVTGTANINLNLAALPYSIAPGASGGVMYSSTNYSGSFAASKINMHIWTYAGASGDLLHFNMTNTTGVLARMYVFNPDASLNSGTYGNAPSIAAYAGTTGNYTVMVGDLDASYGANNYTLKATSSSVLPTDGKEDIASTCTMPAPVGCNKNEAAPTPTPTSIANLDSDSNAKVSNTGYVNVGEPINLATGNVSQLVTDYTTAGTNPLAFTRAYNSLSYTRNLIPTMMGANWRNNYDRYLLIVLNGTNTMAAAQRASGQVLNFYCGAGTTCTPDTDVDASLTYSGSTWTLTDSDDTVETYTVASGVGTLNSIKLRNGYTQTMHYTTGKLSSVTDTYGRTIGLTWTGSVVTGVTTPDSLSLTY